MIVPEKIPDNVLDKISLSPKKRLKYPGIKEEVYVSRFVPDPEFIQRYLDNRGHSADLDKVIVVVRPPATTANYHVDKSDALFDDLLRLLLNTPNAFAIIVPRTSEQAGVIRARLSNIAGETARYLIVDQAVDGLDLAYGSDMLISGGGTMNREAALLGVPVYSIFAGPQGSLDRQMEAEGVITFIRDERDLTKIRLIHRDRQKPNVLTNRVEAFVIETIDSFLKGTF